MFALGLALSASSSIMLLIVILGGGFKFVAWDEHAYQSNTVRYPVRGGPRIVDQRIQDIDLYFFHYESKYTLRQSVDGLSMVPHPHAAMYPYAGGDVEAPGKHQLIECDKEGRVSFWLLLLATALSLVPLYLFFGSWKNNQAAETLVRKVSYVRLFYLGLFVLILAPVFTFPSGDCADSIKDEIELMSHSGYHSLKEVALNPGPGRILSCVAATFVVLLCLLNEKITRATKSSKSTSTEQEQEQEDAAEGNGFEELKEFFSDPVKRLIMGLVLAGSSSMMLFIVLVGGIFKFVAWNENFYQSDRGFNRDQYINFFWFEHKYAGGDDGESMVSHPDDCVVEGHISFWLLVLAFLLSSAPLYLFFGSWRNKIASDTLVKKIAYLRASYLLMLALVIAPTFVFKPSKSCSDAIMTEITDRTPSNFWWSNDTYLQEKENNAGTGRVLSYMVAGAVVLLFVLNEVIRRTTQSDSTSKTDTFSVSKEPENNEEENATGTKIGETEGAAPDVVVDTEEAAPDVVVDTEEAVSAVDDNAVVEQAV